MFFFSTFFVSLLRPPFLCFCSSKNIHVHYGSRRRPSTSYSRVTQKWPTSTQTERRRRIFFFVPSPTNNFLFSFYHHYHKSTAKLQASCCWWNWFFFFIFFFIRFPISVDFIKRSSQWEEKHTSETRHCTNDDRVIFCDIINGKQNKNATNSIQSSFFKITGTIEEKRSSR